MAKIKNLTFDFIRDLLSRLKKTAKDVVSLDLRKGQFSILRFE